jgi:1-acyl-sn-glycerol-3-phosphate acyltransferase
LKPFVYRLSHRVAGTILRVWNRARCEGRAEVPATGGVLLVANHSSHLDPPLVGTSLSRPVHFLARSTLGRFAPFRWFLDALGVLFVDREGSAREGIQAAIEALRAGEVVCMFPEGTRSTDGRVQEFERGALLVLRRAPVVVVPVGIEGAFDALPRGRFFLRPARVTVRFGAPMAAVEALAPGGADELRRRVVALAGQASDPAAGSPTVSPAAAPPTRVEPTVPGAPQGRSATDASRFAALSPPDFRPLWPIRSSPVQGVPSVPGVTARPFRSQPVS